MALTKIAIRRLRRVQALFEEEPKRCDMGTWLEKGEEDALNRIRTRDEHRAKKVPARRMLPACKTVGCVAGWVVATSRLNPEQRRKLDIFPVSGVEAVSDELIGVVGAQELYRPDYWPRDLSDQLSAARPGTRRYATIVNKAIDWFIDVVNGPDADEG